MSLLASRHSASTFRPQSALEPDDCYILHDSTKTRPDLAIEVVWTHGGMDKLDVYRALGVPEVWIWQDDFLHYFVLTGSTYVEQPRSALLPDFDARIVNEILELDMLSDVHRELRTRLPPGS